MPLVLSLQRQKMSTRVVRRAFLRTAGSAIIAGAEFVRLAPGEIPVSPADPKAANSPRLFSGCCAYSYRKALASGGMTMEDLIQKGVELGIDGVEHNGLLVRVD